MNRWWVVLCELLGDMGNFPLAFSICGITCLVGAAATAIVFPPQYDEATRHFSVHGLLHQGHFFDHDEELKENS